MFRDTEYLLHVSTSHLNVLPHMNASAECHTHICMTVFIEAR